MTLPRCSIRCGRERPLSRTKMPSMRWCLAIILALVPLCVVAQGDAPADAEGSITLEALPSRLLADGAFVEIAAAEAGTTRSWSRAGAMIDALTSDVESLTVRTSPSVLEGLPLSALVSFDRQWRFVGPRIAAVDGEIQDQLAPLAKDAQALREKRQAWETTVQSAGLAPASGLGARVSALQRALQDAERALATPLAEGLDLAERAARLAGAVERGQGHVARELRRRDRGLAALDSPPLWRAEAWRPPPTAAERQGGNVELDFLARYESVPHPMRNAALALLMLALPFLVWGLRRARRVLAVSGVSSAHLDVLSRPWSTWLLMALVGLMLAQIDGPVLRTKLLMLLALFPAMRLQPADVRRLFGRWFYLAGGLFLVAILAELLAESALWHRLLVLALASAASMVLGTWWVRQRGRDGRTRLDRTVAGVVLVFAALSAVAAIANVVGNVTLGSLVALGVVESIYVGLLAFAAAHVLTAFAALPTLWRSRFVDQPPLHVGQLLAAVLALLKLGLLAGWGLWTLDALRLLDPMHDLALRLGAVEVGIGEAQATLAGITILVAVVVASFWLSSTLRRILAGDVLPALRLPRGVGNSIATLTHYAVLLVGFAFALSAAGFELSKLAIVLGALGVGIGLGLQDVVRNFVSGLILMVERPLQPGDVVDLGGDVGKVREIGMRATTISTYDGAEVVVPNGLLLAEKMTNWTLTSDRRRIELTVGVAYGSDPRVVLALLQKTTEQVPGVQTDPAPLVLFSGFGESSLDFIIRAWTARIDDAALLRSELGLAIHDALAQADIEIPFPQRDLRLRDWPPGGAASV